MPVGLALEPAAVVAAASRRQEALGEALGRERMTRKAMLVHEGSDALRRSSDETSRHFVVGTEQDDIQWQSLPTAAGRSSWV